MKLRWNDRSIEEQSLFNPAFDALLLRAACRNYSGDGSVLMPLPLAFLILPMILNEQMRVILPTSKTLFATWAANHPEEIAGFGDRAAEMVNVTREAIQFGCTQKWLAVSSAGLGSGPAKLRPDPPRLPTDTDDLRACYAAARFLGRWLPSDRHPATIMSLLGVAP